MSFAKSKIWRALSLCLMLESRWILRVPWVSQSWRFIGVRSPAARTRPASTSLVLEICHFEPAAWWLNSSRGETCLKKVTQLQCSVPWDNSFFSSLFYLLSDQLWTTFALSISLELKNFLDTYQPCCDVTLINKTDISQSHDLGEFVLQKTANTRYGYLRICFDSRNKLQDIQ